MKNIKSLIITFIESRIEHGEQIRKLLKRNKFRHNPFINIWSNNIFPSLNENKLIKTK